MNTAPRISTPHVVVVMGVAGTGKTTIGPLLAAELGVPYAEGDDFHPPANIAKMSAGTPWTTTTVGPGWTPSVRGRTGGRGSAGSSPAPRSSGPTGTGCGTGRRTPSSCI